MEFLAIMPLSQISPGLRLGATILALALAVILHEVSHGWVALLLGDPTAKLSGRLTLNPIKHIDLYGTIIVPMFLWLIGSGVMFGWSKPVPVNYYNLRYGKFGPAIVALAGPGVNFLLLLFFCGLVRLSPADTALPYLFLTIAIMNGFLMLFNLIPIPPLDGSKILYIFLDRRPDIVMWLERYGFYVLIALLFFGGSFILNFVALPALQLTSFVSGISINTILQMLQ